MDMVERFQKATTPQVSLAKKIPALAVDFFDPTNKIQNGFKPFETPNEPTEFSSTALNQYATEVKEIKIPDSFIPLEQGATLNRYGPTQKYYTPGQPKTEGNN